MLLIPYRMRRRSLKAFSTTVSRSWLPAFQVVAVCALTWEIYHLADREPFVSGAIAVFILLALPSAALVFGSRRTLSNAFLIGTALFALDAADEKKRELLQEHLHAIDISTLWEELTGFTLLLKLYQHLIILCALAVCGYIIVYLLLRLIENMGLPRSFRFTGSRSVFWILTAASIINGAIFVTGNYFWSMSHTYVYARTKLLRPFVPSFFLASGVDLLDADQALHIDKAGAQLLDRVKQEADLAEPQQICTDCPDVITIHVESTFDPSILADYAKSPPLARFFDQQLKSSTGFLRTYVLGGYSLISEFSFSCGLDHRIFSTAGLFPNLFLPKFIRRCNPGYLRDHGYDTKILSVIAANGARYGDAYRAYGVDDYRPPDSFVPSPFNRIAIRDKFFVNAAINELNKPRTKPRLIMVLTIFNHGPHGKYGIAEAKQIFPGPYNINAAETEELRDYMNRLNDTIMAFRHLEEYVAQSKVPTVIVYYGDHQPNDPINFSPEAVKRFGPEQVRHVTFWRVARNFNSPYLPENGRYFGIDDLFGEGLHIAGIKPSPELKLKDLLLKNCPSRDETQCGEAERSALRSLIMKATWASP